MRHPEYNHSDLAWAAGFFDGEGCIHIRKGFTKSGPRFSLMVKVNQTCTAPLAFLQQLFGGTIKTATKKEGNKTQWVWGLYGSDAVPFLEETMPFMRVKDSEAGLALLFQATFNNTYQTGGNERKAVPEHIINLRILAYEACKEFKRINV